MIVFQPINMFNMTNCLLIPYMMKTLLTHIMLPILVGAYKPCNRHTTKVDKCVFHKDFHMFDDMILFKINIQVVPTLIVASFAYQKGL